MRFVDKFRSCALKNRSLLCVGLDQVDWQKNKRIVDLTHDLVCAYKPNSAFYEAEGSKGIAALKKICEYIKGKSPNIPIILDAKRGDIGNTNEQYACYAFEYLGADAVTLQPYQGLGALSPFEKYEEKGLIALVKTSNPESVELQDLELKNGKKVWEQVLEEVVKRDKGRGQWGVVVGATHPREMAMARKIVGEMVMLVPGVGAQGAKIEDILSNETSQGGDMIINVSRAILKAESPRRVAESLKQATVPYVEKLR